MAAKQTKRRKTKSTGSMVDKTRVKVQQTEESLGRRILGMGFALIGFLLILGVIILNVLNNIEPQLDEDLNVPALAELVGFTNRDKIVVSGQVEDVNQVIFYVNDRMQTNVVDVEDGIFEFEYIFSDEGEFAFAAVGVEGFPFRKGSEKSEPVSITVDWTPPSADIKLEYASEVESGLVTITGEAEPYVTVSLVQDDEALRSVESDEEGLFEIVNLELAAGENQFRVELEDQAGNRNVLERRVVVESLVDAPADILGQAYVPEASGDLFKALNMLFNNNLMFVFGLIALIALVGSSGVVLYRVKRES